MKEIEGNLVDVKNCIIYPARIHFDDRIRKIEKTNEFYDNFILPGLIDSHIHIESTLMCPSRFCEKVVPHGTAAVVADPHEIANVAGIKGIEYMISDSPSWFKMYLMAPSCVPASPFETSGYILDADAVLSLLERDDIIGLGEVMNYPAVIRRDEDIMKKIGEAKKLGKRIDGHAPFLSGDMLEKYIEAGIETDHEVISYQEGKEKIEAGLKVIIREGSSERNMKGLVNLVKEYPDKCFFGSDDRMPQDMREGHVDYMIRKAISYGIDPMSAIRCCTMNPAMHYGLDTGIIEEGKAADFVIVGVLEKMNVLETWIGGEIRARNGKLTYPIRPKEFPLCINRYPLSEEDFIIRSDKKSPKANVIGIVEGQIVTTSNEIILEARNGIVCADSRRKIMHIAVVNRYRKAPVSKGFVSGFRIKGAIASSIAHDSHNIIVVGDNPTDMLAAVNHIRDYGGECAQ